jgi:hypothetical protein
MKTPMSEKTQEMKDAIESLFPGTAKAIAEHRCPLCSNPIGGFRDRLSEREYEISGMCQGCQDRIFRE